MLRGFPAHKAAERSISKSALTILRSTHKAGILHGTIREDHVLIGDPGVAFIDFADSEHCKSRKSRKEERKELRGLLILDHDDQ